MVKQSFLAGVCAVAALSAAAADVTITKPYFRWLFNGFGFQNSEANFLRIMPEDFRDQRVLKTFREVSPSFARVYTGFADSTKAELDSFADYYDLTFRRAQTTLYAVPCAMPILPDTLDPEAYAEKVAKNLAYLVNVRNCRKIRYYCLTNELMAGERWGWFSREKKWELYKVYNAALFHAFRRHGLDIRLLSTDYIDRTPPPVGGVRLNDDGTLVWDAATDPAHVYYRVFRDGAQIASTVATRLDVKGAKGDYAVRSVDRWNNMGR